MRRRPRPVARARAREYLHSIDTDPCDRAVGAHRYGCLGTPDRTEPATPRQISTAGERGSAVDVDRRSPSASVRTTAGRPPHGPRRNRSTSRYSRTPSRATSTSRWPRVPLAPSASQRWIVVSWSMWRGMNPTTCGPVVKFQRGAAGSRRSRASRSTIAAWNRATSSRRGSRWSSIVRLSSGLLVGAIAGDGRAKRATRLAPVSPSTLLGVVNGVPTRRRRSRRGSEGARSESREGLSGYHEHGRELRARSTGSSTCPHASRPYAR